MLNYFETLQDNSGNALVGATCVVTAYPGGGATPIYSSNGTAAPIAASTAIADATGQISFFVPDGAYILTYFFNGTQYKVKAPVQMIDPLALTAGTDSGAVNAYVVTSAIFPATLYVGLKLEFKALATNTGASTLNFNALGVQPINQPGGAALQAGQIQANGLHRVEWDGTQWQLFGSQSPPFYATIQAEITAGVAIANSSYPPYDARRYGTVDTTGAVDSTTALNNGILVCNVSGGILQIPQGTIKFTNLTMKPNTTLQGQGKSATLLTTATAGDGIKNTLPINASNSANTQVKDLAITSTNSSNTGGGYVDVGGTFVLLQNVKVTGFKYGIIFDQTELGEIDLCDIESPATGGIWLTSGADHTGGALAGFTNRISITRNQLNGFFGAVASGTAIIDDGGAVHTIRNNNFNLWVNHLRIAGAGGVTQVCIDGGNEFEVNTDYNIILTNTTSVLGTVVAAPAMVLIDANFFSNGLNKVCNIIACTALCVTNNRTVTSAPCFIGTANLNTLFAYGNFDSNIGQLFDAVAPNHFETAVARGGFVLKGSFAHTGTMGIMGAAPVAQSAGFGVPTGAARIAAFPGATATLAQTSGAVADLITVLKSFGLLGA